MKHLLTFLLSSILLTASSLASVQVVGSLARTKSATPGESFEGVIHLKNTGSQASEIRVRQTDYLFAADGTNRYDEPGTTARSNADWLSVTPPRLVIGPNETAQVHYKCKVPSRSELKGAYWSMIMIEPVAAPAATAKGGAQQVAVGLQTMLRFGVQIVTEIGDGTRAIKVLDKRLVHAEGTSALQLDIANTGERTIQPAVSVELYDSKGTSVGRFEARKTHIFPTCSIRATAALKGVLPGTYTALVLLDNGDANVMGAQYTLEIAPIQPAPAISVPQPALASSVTQ